MSRVMIVPVRCRRRSERVVFPGSIWAIMLKLRICAASIVRYGVSTLRRIAPEDGRRAKSGFKEPSGWNPAPALRVSKVQSKIPAFGPKERGKWNSLKPDGKENDAVCSSGDW